jgi:hypothetical protein
MSQAFIRSCLCAFVLASFSQGQAAHIRDVQQEEQLFKIRPFIPYAPFNFSRDKQGLSGNIPDRATEGTLPVNKCPFVAEYVLSAKDIPEPCEDKNGVTVEFNRTGSGIRACWGGDDLGYEIIGGIMQPRKYANCELIPIK